MTNAQIYSSNGKMIYMITLDENQKEMNVGTYKVIVEKNKPIRMTFNDGSSLNKKAKYIINLVEKELSK